MDMDILLFDDSLDHILDQYYEKCVLQTGAGLQILH